MKLSVAAALAAWLIAAAALANAQIADIEALRFTAVPRMPDGPPLRMRPTPPLRFEVGAVGGGVTTYAYGTMTVEELDPDRLRMTYTITRLVARTAQGVVDTPMPSVTLTRSEVDSSGKPIKLERNWQGLPIEPPSPQLMRQTWSAMRTRLQDASKDWLKVLDDYDDTPVYRGDLTIGSSLVPSTLDELLAIKLEYVEAMVRGNSVGFWGDLPQGTLTAARKDFLAGVIRSRGMLAAYESDVRIRGTTTYAGRSFVFVSGTFRKTPKSGPVVEGMTDMLINPANGGVGLYRKRLMYRGTGASESQYVKVGLP
jgi:hypothetical protein